MHNNNIGLLRLIFASLVIVAHAYMLTGIVEQEPLLKASGTMGLGGLGVDCFFLLSGYLITQSMLRSRSAGEYLLKRVLRIYPAFLLAYLIASVIALSILADYPVESWRALLLARPVSVPGVLGDQELNANLSAWTIAYEFRCYLGVMLLGSLGLLAERRRILGLTILSWALFVLMLLPELWQVRSWKAPVAVELLIGNPLPSLRFFSIFTIGMTVYLYCDEILPRLNGIVALLSLGGIVVTISHPVLGEPLFALFAAAIVFWAAFRLDLGPLQSINDRWDISYGTYLYGWPIGTLMIWLWPDLALGTFIAGSLAGAWLLGTLSWFLLERHFNLKTLQRLVPVLQRARR